MNRRQVSHEVIDGVLRIRFGDGEADRTTKVDCRVDLSAYGDIVGVEILHFRRQMMGAMAPVASTSETSRVAYDAEVDAFYVRIARDNAPYQRKSSAEAVIDDQGRVVALDVIMVSVE